MKTFLIKIHEIPVERRRVVDKPEFQADLFFTENGVDIDYHAIDDTPQLALHRLAYHWAKVR